MPRPRGTHLLRRLVLIDFVILIVWARKSRPSLSDSIDSIQLRALHETSSESLAHIRAGTVRGARCRCRRRHRPLDVVPEMRSAVASNATASRRGRDRVRGLISHDVRAGRLLPPSAFAHVAGSSFRMPRSLSSFAHRASRQARATARGTASLRYTKPSRSNAARSAAESGGGILPALVRSLQPCGCMLSKL